MSFTWQAQPRQMAFLERQEDEVLFGGARGGGKTDALVAYMVLRASKYPKSTHLILRREWVDLVKAGGAVSRLQEFVGSQWSWHGQYRRFTAPNGSTIEFGHCKEEEDRRQYQGAQYHTVGFEEATQFSDTQYYSITGSLRSSRIDVPTRIRLTGNPGGVGHGWVKKRFIDPFPAGNVTITEKDTGLTISFIPSKVFDNRALTEADPRYIARLKALPSSLRDAWLNGSWDVFEGQVFTEFDPSIHVLDPVSIPSHWRRIIALDYGFNAPFCALWMAQDPDTYEVLVYRELYNTGQRDRVQAQSIIKAMGPKERNQISMVIADPSMWARKGENEVSPADIYIKEGLSLVPAKNSRLHGKMRVHEFLAPEPRPLLRIFTPCVNLIRTLPTLVYDDKRVEDVNTRTEDHAYDALRYGLMALSRRPLGSFQMRMTEDLGDPIRDAQDQEAQRRMYEIART